MDVNCLQHTTVVLKPPEGFGGEEKKKGKSDDWPMG